MGIVIVGYLDQRNARDGRPPGMSLKVNWIIPVAHRDFNRMAASIWIRCLQLIPYFEARGVRCVINEPGPDVDINVFVRLQDKRAYELARRLKKQGQKIVCDLVVNYFDEAEVLHLGKPVTARHREQILKMLSVADAVTCSSDNIAERARQFHPVAEYFPDSIDARHFRYRKSVDDFSASRLRVVWSGVAAKARELEPVLPLLEKRDIELLVISDGTGRLRLPGRWWRRGFPHRFVRWDYETFPQRILEGDLCIAYRSVDNPYNRGHSLFKIGVFMAQGVPAIASPVPSYEEVLAPGKAGRICYSIREWEDALDEVLEQRTLLQQWSKEAQKALEPYSTSSIVDRYLAWFGELARKEVN